MSTNLNNHHGRLFIISAPSGTGKTTLSQMLLKNVPDMIFSISHTTRNIRDGEQDGVDYFFIEKELFQQKIKENVWAEWAKVHGNYYGTSMEFIDKKLEAGIDVLLDIDVQGAKQIVKKYPDCITIFIMPPSMDELKTRLILRGTDSREVIEKRLNNAEQEIAQKNFYKYCVVNDNIQIAADELINIVVNKKIK
ncbi:MAG: guanylate kinase [Desulfobacteraceae bacterium 4572_19]|nr:MAG: guanylate kinase [Desulfobacteraceae bacterium 4572_19]